MRYNQVIHVRFRDDQLSFLVEKAREEKKNISELIREMVDKKIAAKKQSL